MSEQYTNSYRNDNFCKSTTRSLSHNKYQIQLDNSEIIISILGLISPETENTGPRTKATPCSFLG